MSKKEAFLEDFASLCRKHGMTIKLWASEYAYLADAEEEDIVEFCDVLRFAPIDAKGDWIDD